MPWFAVVLASLAQGLAFDMHENGPLSETVLIIAPPHWRIGPGHVGDTERFSCDKNHISSGRSSFRLRQAHPQVPVPW